MRALICVGLGVAVLVGCWGPAPGQGAKAERGYARAQPIIAALDSFHKQRHTYPNALTELVPAWLPASALAAPKASQENYPWTYIGRDTAYSLEFRYTGPGMNECLYEVPPRRWSCSGRF